MTFPSENLDNMFGDSDTLHVDIDEKCFYAYKKSYVIYVPVEFEHVVKEFHEVIMKQNSILLMEITGFENSNTQCDVFWSSSSATS